MTRSIFFGLLVLCLAGCAGRPVPGNGTEEQPAVRPAGQPLAEDQCKAGSESWRSTGSPKRGGSFTRALSSGSGVGHLDLTTPGATVNAIPNVYEKLVGLRLCFSEDITVEPELARSWELSSDAKTWTFKLRDDVRWQNKPPVNGRRFSPADVAWTIDLQQKGGQLAPYWTGVTYDNPDPQSIALHLPQPDADFLAKLANGTNVIMPREVKEQLGDFKTEAIGTGPYIVKEFRQGQQVLLERNPDYYQQGADGKSLPYIDGMRLVYFGDGASIVASLRAGQLDLNDSQGMRKLDWESLKQNSKVKPMQTLAGSSWGLFFNLSKRPFDDVRVRKAFALAVDTGEVIDGAYQGAAVPTGFMPAAIREFAWTPENNAEKFKSDPGRAKQLLADAGFPNGLELPMEVPAQYQLDGEIVQKQLEKAGVKTAIATGNAGTTAIMSGPNFLLTWGGLTPTAYFPDRWLNGPLHSKSNLNYIHLSDPKVDALAEAQIRETDLTKRKQVINEMQDYLYEVMPFVPGVTRTYFYIYTCRVQNMRPYSPTHNLEGIAQAWLDPSDC